MVNKVAGTPNTEVILLVAHAPVLEMLVVYILVAALEQDTLEMVEQEICR